MTPPFPTVYLFSRLVIHFILIAFFSLSVSLHLLSGSQLLFVVLYQAQFYINKETRMY